MAEKTPAVRTVLRDVPCPDGTRFVVYNDGTWERLCWDGSFVTDSESEYTDYATAEDRQRTRDAVLSLYDPVFGSCERALAVLAGQATR